MASRLLESECVAMFVLAGVFVFAQTFARGQKGGGGGGDVTAQAPGQSATPASGQSSSGGPSSPSRASLSGITFSRADWQRIDTLPSPEAFGLFGYRFSLAHPLEGSLPSNIIVFCYRLVPGHSSTQPFILEPDLRNAPSSGGFEMYANQHSGKPSYMGHYLVLRIDMSPIKFRLRDEEKDRGEPTYDRIQAVNFNVTSQGGSSFNAQRGSTINPSPIHPTTAQGRPHLPLTGSKLITGSNAGKYVRT